MRRTISTSPSTLPEPTPAHIHKSTPVELIVGFNFVINNNSAAQTIKAGQTASYNLDVVPLGNGSVFPGNVTLSCSTASLPPLTTCSFTPSLVASGQGDTNLVLKIQTTAATSAVSRMAAPHGLWYDLGLSLAANHGSRRIETASQTWKEEVPATGNP